VNVGDILPRAGEAVIAEEKLRGYLLNAEHPIGGHKARVFAAALDLHADDWAWLREQILEAVLTSPVTDIRRAYEGWRCTVVVRVRGHSGDERPVVTGWRVPDGEGRPHLVTAYVQAKLERM
jgi:hypothetical protein